MLFTSAKTYLITYYLLPITSPKILPFEVRVKR